MNEVGWRMMAKMGHPKKILVILWKMHIISQEDHLV